MVERVQRFAETRLREDQNLYCSTMRIILKVADISNPVRPVALCQAWAARISEEYMLQTEEEDKRGLPNQLKDFRRGALNLPRTQVGFIDFLVRDMIELLHCFAFTPDLLRLLYSNRAYWHRLSDALRTHRNSQSTPGGGSGGHENAVRRASAGVRIDATSARGQNN